MSVNFQIAICQETLHNPLFGLCDDNNGTKAYTDIDNPRNWIATVKNDQQKKIMFTAIDKCVIQDNEYLGRGRCDGMLTTDEYLCFVELKDQAKGWMSAAIEQLESTIQFFSEGNDMAIFKHKKAFACNKQHKHFQEIDNELNLRFFRKYKVRIDVQADIIIV
jgi:hypothetical protein